MMVGRVVIACAVASACGGTTPPLPGAGVAPLQIDAAYECDLCPMEPEIYNGWEDEDGCPERVHPRREDGVFFEPGKATVTDDWVLEAIRQVASDLVADPAIERVGVVGRAAPGDASPKQLSQRRVAFVIAELTAAGVAVARLEAHALGDAPAPDDGRSPEVLGRRTALVVLRERGQDATLDTGRELALWTPLPHVPEPTAPLPCVP